MARTPAMEAMALGDLNHEDLSDILDGPKARQLRRRLLDGKTEGLLCETCNKSGSCNLYGDPVSGLETQGMRQSDDIIRMMPSADCDALERLELGLNDLCNMKCIMCAFTKGEASPLGMPTRGHMNLSVIKKALAQAKARSEDDFTVYLHWVGEPLIHPEIQKVLRLVHQSGARLHLVTNAISLSEEICHWLFHFSGRHTINFSLNAWTDDTFRRVNGSKYRDRVYSNIERFLKLRQDRNAEDKWTVICSAVVLEQNHLEISQFVNKWTGLFNSYGSSSSLSINGKGVQSPNQIMLLRETDHPHADVYFRGVLRDMDIHDSSWPLGPWSVVDSWVLGKATAQVALDSIDLAASVVRPSMALKLLNERGWNDLQLSRLIAHCDAMDPRFPAALRRMALEIRHKLGVQASKALFQLSLPIQSIPMAMILSPQLGKEWFSRLMAGSWRKPNLIRDLAEAISWRISLAEYIPDTLNAMPETQDASAAIISLARGESPVFNHSPSTKQIRFLAKWIYQKDSPQLCVNNLPSITDRGDLCSAIVLSLNPDNLQKSLAASVHRFHAAPDWQLRALRRRWLMAGSDQDSPHMELPLVPISDMRDVEQTLLQMTLSPVSAAKHFNALIVALENGLTPQSRFWQDLAEAVLRRIEIRQVIKQSCQMELDSLRRMLGQSNRQKCSHFGLSVAVFLKGMGIDFPLNWAYRHVQGMILPGWQQAQLKELGGK